MDGLGVRAIETTASGSHLDLVDPLARGAT
jgi:hypothetical protein